MRQLTVDLEHLHQFKRTNHPIHRCAQFVSDGGEEFILEAVAVGQLLVEGFQLEPGLLEDARAFFLHRVDAVGQGQREQANFQRRANLTGVHGEEHIRQVAQHHQRVDHPTGEKGRPGDDEIARHTHAAHPGEDASTEDHYGKAQRQVGGQTQ